MSINAHAPETGDARPARGRPALDSASQRLKILEAAAHSFIAKGFAATTLDAVSRAAGVTKRTIYQHVGNKDELFRVVCKERLPLAARLRFDVTLDGADVPDVVMAMARDLLRHAFAPEVVALERVLTIESMRFPRLVGEVIEDGMHALNRNIAGLFDALIETARVPPLDTARAADIFYDVVIGNRLFRMTMGHGEAPPGDEELAQRVDMFVVGHLLKAGDRR